MSTDEYSTEMELYGVSPGIITMIMIIVTVIAPYGFISNHWGSFPFYFVYEGFYGLFWIFASPLIYLPLCLPNVFFAYWIVRYYQARSPKNTALLVGLLSLLLPTLLFLFVSSMFGSFVVIYPFPLQFLVGYLLLWRIDGPEVISPWSGMRLDLSWWKWTNPKRKSDWDPFEEEKKNLETTDSIPEDGLSH